MKETFGLANAKNAKPPDPKPSPKDFKWPSQSDHDDKVAQKIAATLQELLPKRDWKHTHLAAALYGTAGPHGAPKNTGATRRWVVGEHPIPNEQTAGYIAEVLGISMARLLEPEGKFDPTPPMIRPRSDSKRFPPTEKNRYSKVNRKKAKGGKTAGGKDREKQRAYNAAYRARQKAGEAKRKYTHKAQPNGHAADEGATWRLAEGVEAPEFTISSSEDQPGHVKLEVTATLPHERAMAILHMLKHEGAEA